jgi:hypothetical protein
MSFADLRRSALEFGALSTDLFAELVAITNPGGTPRQVTVKIEHDNPRDRARREFDTVDTMERIRVTVQLGTDDYRLPSRPQPSATLVRSDARDPEGKPFQFADEIAYEGDTHAVYVFARPRRVTQGRRIR